MRRRTKNISASVHQRLLNKAKESGRPFNELLQGLGQTAPGLGVLSRSLWKRPKRELLQASSSRSALASFRSRVSKPSVNQL